MKNLVKISLVLVFSFIANSICAQKKWVVEYNKLDNTYSYFEVLTSKGKETEKVLTKVPAVDYGDVVKFRCINLNEYVFSVQIDEGKILNKEANPGSVVNSVVSMLNPMGFVGNFGKSIDIMNDLPTVNAITTRGEDEFLQMKNEVLALNEELSSLLEMASQLETAATVIYAEDLSLDEIKQKFDESVKQVDLGLFRQRSEEFSIHLEEIESSHDEEKWEQAKLDTEMEDIQEAFSEFEEAYEGDNSPVDFKKISKDLNKKTFSVERSIVITRDINDIGYGTESIVYFNIQFEADKKPMAEKDEERSYDRELKFKTKDSNTLRSNIVVQLPMKGVIMPKLTTGIIGIKTFGGTARYSFTSINSSWGSDSVSISRSFDNSVKLALGSMLNFSISTKRNLVPSFGFGASYSFAKGNSDNLGLLVGGSLGLKSFPFLSIGYGVNFQQTKVLLPNYQLDTPVAASADYNGEYDVFETKFTPGVFVGLNIQF
jgi:hypothetical protein